eukprot:CAMPEP_0181367884 /NCGR_PEP_ID=MMETSP1106-20121128/11723_1 /TAXON_ID=81844 /ORGANISM="Mantoniella antarctica, Strain SL-175" /LENGTH=133 /DNA_ID=CAMNT_0023483825 /DNA_START=24 /DNA_END=421 /DNA_ORIENTATION=+
MVHLQQHADHHVMLTTRVRPSRTRLLLCSRTPVVSGCPGPVAPFRAQTTLDLLRPQALYLPVLSRDFQHGCFIEAGDVLLQRQVLAPQALVCLLDVLHLTLEGAHLLVVHLHPLPQRRVMRAHQRLAVGPAVL